MSTLPTATAAVTTITFAISANVEASNEGKDSSGVRSQLGTGVDVTARAETDTPADHDLLLASAITDAKDALTFDLDTVDGRSEAKAEVERLRALCKDDAAVDLGLAILNACPGEAFHRKGLFNAARTDEDELVLDWDDDDGPSVTLFVASSDGVVYVCDWTHGEESGTLPDDLRQRALLLQEMFDRLNRERA